jgi:hypothetical protein
MRKLLVLIFLLISMITVVSATKLLLDQQAKAGCNAIYYGDVGLSSGHDHNAICAAYNTKTVSCDENRNLCTWPPSGHPNIVAENNNFACCCQDSCALPTTPAPKQVSFKDSNCRYKCCTGGFGVKKVCLNADCPGDTLYPIYCFAFCSHVADWNGCMAQPDPEGGCPPPDDLALQALYAVAPTKCGDDSGSSNSKPEETGSGSWW